MGVFSEFQRKYAENGIMTFPMNGKKPAVKGYQNVTTTTSASYSAKFSDANAMAFLAGPANNITVIDIDSDDQTLWTDTINRHGNTPIKVGTPSGGLHLWYRHAGEPRIIRPYVDQPIDLLGGGVVIAPPSVIPKGAYEFLDGGLDQVRNLQPAVNLNWSTDTGRTKARHDHSTNNATSAHGGRNNGLYRYLMREAVHLDDLNELDELAWDYVRNHIDRNSGHRFTDAEVSATIRSVKKTTLEGRNMFGGQPHTIMLNEIRDVLHDLGPDALFLYSYIQRMNSGREEFVVANALSDHMPSGKWARKRLVAARNALEENGLIVVVKPATYTVPTLYGWPMAGRY